MVSLGCSKNLVDTEMMLGKLLAKGYEFTDDETEADIEKAIKKGKNTLHNFSNIKSHNPFIEYNKQTIKILNKIFININNIIDSINPLWLYYALKFNNLNRYAQGVAQPGISVNIINEMPLIYPPLYLQQEFAEKIDRIEQQKKLISQSIKETEDLFNSRMSYYFN